MKSPRPQRPSGKAALAYLVATCVFVLALAVASSAVVALVRGPQPTVADPGRSAPKRVDTWTAMPQLTEPGNMPPAPFTGERATLVDTTLRQTVRVSTGGERIRLRFSNAFGTTPLPLTAVTVALPLDGRAGVSAVEPGTLREVTFAGRRSTTVPAGAQVASDPLDFWLRPATNLTVTTYLANGQASLALTSHPGSRTTSYLRDGDGTAEQDLPGATPVDHWYLLSDVEALSRPDTRAVAVLGDSLSDGRGSTTTHHFRVLRESGVIRQVYRGTAKMNGLRRDDLDDPFPGLLGSVLTAAAGQAVRLGSVAVR